MTVERVEVLMEQSHDEESSLKLLLRPNKTMLVFIGLTFVKMDIMLFTPQLNNWHCIDKKTCVIVRCL